MEMHMEQHIQPDDQDITYLNSTQANRYVKTEPSYWESDIYGNSSSLYGTDLNTCTTLETYIPNSDGLQTAPATYANLSAAGLPLSSLYFISQEENLNYEYLNYNKVNETIMNYDEGIGSSSSSIQSASPLNENDQRASPPQRSNDRLSTADSDFAEPEEPSMIRIYRPETPKQQCVKCGISNSANGQWIAEGTGHFLCTQCYGGNGSPPYVAEDEVKKKKRTTAASRRSHQLCSNCKTSVTSLWRRNLRGEFVCNACGLYEKLHKRPRPEIMKKDTIQTRKRRPRNSESKKKSETTVERTSVTAIPAPIVQRELPPYPHLNVPNHHLQSISHEMNILPPMSSPSAVFYNSSLYPGGEHNFNIEASRVFHNLGT